MNKLGRLNLLVLLALTIIVVAFVACGDGTTPTDDASSGGEAQVGSSESATEPTPTDSAPVAGASVDETPTASPTGGGLALSLDDYITQLDCGSPPDGMGWETYGDVSATLSQAVDLMSPLAPPSELADWHRASLATFQKTKDAVDEFPKGDALDFAELAAIFESFEAESAEHEEIVSRMTDDTRRRMMEAGCIDDDGDGATQPASTPTSAPSAIGPAPTPEPDADIPVQMQPKHLDDIAALHALYTATDGPNWADNTNWLTDAPLDDWRGVVTYTGGRVVALLIGHNRLSGEIPPELGGLSNLEELDLEWNQLTGDIPPELGNLPSLRYIYLADNQLSGEIPPELGNLPNLEVLRLGGNQFSGCIPRQLQDVADSDLDQLGLPFCDGA